MLEIGIDAATFRSTAPTADLILEADCIYTMTSGHRKALLTTLPELSEKTFTLLEGKNVSDPFGQNLDVYRQTFEMMRPRLMELAEELP